MLGKAIVRVSAFLGKEIREVLRQPWLVVRLILGPFLILLLVGLGYTNQARVLRAVLVVPPDEPQLTQQVQDYVSKLGPQLDLVGTTVDQKEELQRLRAGQADVVVVIPPRAYDKISAGQQATVEMYHNEIDPNQVSYVQQFGEVYVAAINRRILQSFAEEAKKNSGSAHQNLQEARNALTAARKAAEAGNSAQAQAELAQASTRMDRATAVLGASALILGSVGQGLGLKGVGLEVQEPLNLPATGSTGTGPDQATQDNASFEQKATAAEQDLARLDDQLARLDRIPAGVLISPLTTETRSVATYNPSFVTFYAPSVLALILQHVAISIGALALVREKFFGAVELFRVAPVSALEIMIGKYGSYMVFIAVLASILTAAMIYLLGVPLFGTVANLVLSLVLLIFASLGIGMAISATSGTDSQAIQASMIVLLASMFFSGFVFPFFSILVPVRYIGYLLPVTYGITSLQNVMLKGTDPPYAYIAALAVEGVLLFLFTWWRYQRALVRA